MGLEQSIPCFEYHFGIEKRLVFDTTTLIPFFKFMLFSYLFNLRNHPEVHEFLVNGTEYTKRYVSEQLTLLHQEAKNLNVTDYFDLDCGVEFYIEIAEDVRKRLLYALKQTEHKHCINSNLTNPGIIKFRTEFISERIVKDPRKLKFSRGRYL